MYLRSVLRTSLSCLLTASLQQLKLTAADTVDGLASTWCFPSNQPQYPAFNPSDCDSLIQTMQTYYDKPTLEANRYWYTNGSLPYFYEDNPRCIAEVESVALKQNAMDIFSLNDIIVGIQTFLKVEACQQHTEPGKTTTNGGTAQLASSSTETEISPGGFSYNFRITVTYLMVDPNGKPWAIKQPSLLSPAGAGMLPVVVPS